MRLDISKQLNPNHQLMTSTEKLSHCLSGFNIIFRSNSTNW